MSYSCRKHCPCYLFAVMLGVHLKTGTPPMGFHLHGVLCLSVSQIYCVSTVKVDGAHSSSSELGKLRLSFL